MLIYNDGGGSNSGHVRIYENNNGTWTQIGSDIDGEGNSDYFGWSVSLSDDGSVVAIGGIYDDGAGSTMLAMYVFMKITMAPGHR